MSVEPARWWHHFDDFAQQRDANLTGMWLFLATEILVFGALFTGYTIYRWTYPEAFEAASGRLNLLIGAVNTVVLLGSSLTMVLAVRAAQLGQRTHLTLWLVVTALLGSAFLLLKAVEYYLDYQEKLVPVLTFDPAEWHGANVHPQHVELFLYFYYVMTGLHALHLTIGILIMLALAAFAWRGAFHPEDHNAVEIWGLYWHFIDVVWIFLLPLLYLIGTREAWY
jgi:cytochrome c oxidase subunit 3